MRKHKKSNPTCAFCGKGKGLHTHHIESIQFAPERAADPTNFLSLCGKRCHITIGHGGNYKQYVHNVQKICESVIIVKPIKQGCGSTPRG